MDTDSGMISRRDLLIAAGTALVSSCELAPAVGPVADLVAGPLAVPISSPPESLLLNTGVNVRLEEIRPGLLARAADLGFHWLRTDVVWESVERLPGSFDFSAEKAAFDLARSAGFEILGILDYGHPAYTDDSSPSTSWERQRFARFARAAEENLGDSVRLWEVWNEPNHPRFWKAAPDPEDFAELVVVTARAIWSVSPDRQVIAGGLSGVDVPFLQPVSRRLARLGRKGPIALGIHPYRDAPPESLCDELRAAGLVDEAGRARTPEGLPLWLTEWGYNRLSEDMTPIRQGELDVRIPLVAASLGIPISVIFELADARGAETQENSYGLLAARSLEPYPAGIAWQQAAALFSQIRDPAAGLEVTGERYSLRFADGVLSWQSTGEPAGCRTEGGSEHVVIGQTEFCLTRTAGRR